MSEADKAYRAAVREIAKVRKAGRTHLDLNRVHFRALERLPHQIADCVGLEMLDLSGTLITDAGLAPIAGLREVQVLNLSSTQITDVGLAQITGLTRLQSLSLSYTQITDAGLAHISGLTGLQELYLHETQITDAGLAQVAGLAALQELYLSGTQITDAGLAHLSEKASLKKLVLNETKITDLGLVELADLTKLESLFLNKTKITNAGLGHIAKIQALVWLGLGNTNITNLDAIAALENLQCLNVGGTGVRDLRPICEMSLTADRGFGLTYIDTPAAERDPKLAELAVIEYDDGRTTQTLAYLRGLPPYPQEYLFEDSITVDAILSAQTPLGWKFSPVHGALVVYIEETPLSQFQTQMAQQTALRAEDLKRKIGGANFGVRGDVAVEVKRLTDILADDSRTLSERSFDLWASLISLGGHLDSHDRGRNDGRDPLDLLSPEQRTALVTLLTIAGNLVRSFPQIKDMDEGAGNFLRRDVTLDMVAQMIEQALRAAFVAEQSAALMQHVAGVAKGTGGQADKATSVTVRGLGNLITSASLIIGKRVLQVAGAAAIGAATGAGVHVGEAVADVYELEKPAIAFIERISGIALQLIDVMPADEAAQVRAALREAQDKIDALRAAGDVTRR